MWAVRNAAYPLLLRAFHPACDPGFHVLDRLLVGNRNGLAAFAGIPAVEHERLVFHVFDESLAVAIAVVFGIFDGAAKIADRQSLPEHGDGSELPVKAAGSAGGGIVAHVVVAIAAAHRAHAVAV